MTNRLERLKIARALIATPEQWTQDALARNQIGVRIPVDSPHAICFCSLGALRRSFVDAHESDFSDEFWSTVSELTCHLPPRSGSDLVFFNDTTGRTHEQVLAVFDAAIERLETADSKRN